MVPGVGEEGVHVLRRILENNLVVELGDDGFPALKRQFGTFVKVVHVQMTNDRGAQINSCHLLIKVTN